MHSVVAVEVVVLSAVLGMFVGGGDCYSGIRWCDPEGPFSGEADGENPPTVNLTVREKPGKEQQNKMLVVNETFTVLVNEDVGVAFFCAAPYPIQWVEIYGEDSDGYETESTTLWNDRVATQGMFGSLEEFMNDEDWTYQSSLQIKFKGRMCSRSTYSCQAVANPCLQANAVTTIDKRKDTVSVRVSDEILYAFNDTQLHQNKSTGGSDYGRRVTNSTTKCPAVLSYGYSSDDDFPRWECKTAAGVGITETSESNTCDSAAHCNIFLQHNRGSQECINYVKQCFYCAPLKEQIFYPGFVTCKDPTQGLLLAIHYFYSVPQFDTQKPVLYFRWEDANPNIMLRLHSPPSETYWNESIIVRCEISRYYFSYGHRFALQYENGTFQFLNASDGTQDSKYNVNIMNTTLVLNDFTLKRIFCLAPIWNSTEWVNQSVEIVVLRDPIQPSFSNASLSKLLSHQDIYQKKIFNVGQVNVSIDCDGYGRPMPTADWTIPSVINSSLFVAQTISKSSRKLTFPHATHLIEGEYICTLENFMGQATKTVTVVVRDRYWKVVVGSFLMIFMTISICIIAMTLCWKKIKEQRKELRLLTESEIKEFMDGNIDAVHANDYLDTADLIQSLPYNTKYEIPKEMIHIDQSVILGSGNFGQVLKGHIQVLNNQDGKRVKNELNRKWSSLCTIEVAVKTVKANMEVMHFKTLLSEVKIMAYIGKHTNIVTLVGACTRNIRRKEIYIAVEYCTHGSLESFLRKYRKSFINLVKDDMIIEESSLQRIYENMIGNEESVAPLISTYHLIKWAREIANGMDYLGSKKIIHGDLAARNVFLSREMIAKIGDFGLSRQLLEYSTYVKNHEYPLPWKHLAFEALQEMKFSVFSDIWAYGVTIWEIFTLANRPYPGVNWSPEFLDQLVNGMRMHKPSYATTKIYNLMLDCWSIEPVSRPSFLTIKCVFESLMSDSVTMEYFEPEFLKTKKRISPKIHAKMTNVYHNCPTADSMSPSPRLFLKNAEKSPSIETTEDTQGYLVPYFEEPSTTNES